MLRQQEAATTSMAWQILQLVPAGTPGELLHLWSNATTLAGSAPVSASCPHALSKLMHTQGSTSLHCNQTWCHCRMLKGIS